MQLEEDAERLRASELVDQFKLEMGKEPSSGAGERGEGKREEPSAAPPPETEKREEASKTIGRRERSGS